MYVRNDARARVKLARDAVSILLVLESLFTLRAAIFSEGILEQVGGRDFLCGANCEKSTRDKRTGGQTREAIKGGSPLAESCVSASHLPITLGSQWIGNSDDVLQN